VSLGRTQHLTPPSSGCGRAINRHLPSSAGHPKPPALEAFKPIGGDVERAATLSVVDAPLTLLE
jgi:hypothetical protein